ncbi:maltokinase N-terminal cap-like domain-containing protein [Microlunatus sp. Y2014]|uniref:maltokinase N-terminal cap-like domain-containing protein n=1 Tax=Microlunatus sp. Y2014 TaxID=3418488 RepID=UPI003DA73F53
MNAQDLCWRHLRTARWFGGKGRSARLRGLTPLPWLVPPGGQVAVQAVVADVGYDDGDGEFYQLLLAYGPAVVEPWGQVEVPGHGALPVGDATADPQARLLLWEAVRAAPRLRDEVGEVDKVGEVGELTVTVLDSLPAVDSAHRFAGEQSNTSLLYGNAYLLKLFRRLEPGRNLDIEVHRVLAERGSTDVARLDGWVSATWPAGRTDLTTGTADLTMAADLAMVVEQLPAATDGWQAALDSLRAGTGFADRAGELGRTLARVHADLADAFGTDVVDGGALAASMGDQLDRYATAAPDLLPHVAGLRRCFDRLAAGAVGVQRIHGDCHLGQTMITPNGWKVIDFEGEPAKGLAERARPDSPWRDVAGVLRSFSYAVAQPDLDEVPDLDADARRRWLTDCRNAFLAGYTGGDGPVDATGPLDAYEADRAAYEVVYETRNRPTWVPIPLADAARLAGTPTQEEP